MTSPALSVVVPAYRNAATLRQTMTSVLEQVGVDFELIVSDHTSPDATRAVMEEFAHDPRVVLLDTPAGGGAPANWNRVTEAATGQFIKLVCGDDEVRPGTLARQVGILRETGAVFTASKRDIVDADGEVLRAGWGLGGLSGVMPGTEAVRRTIRAGSNLFGEPASTMMVRSALAEAGNWYPRFPYLIDLASYSRVLAQGDFAPDLEVGATFRMSIGQWSVALTRDQAKQARGFNQWFADQHPGVLSRGDLRLGNAKATAMAYARRASYWVLRRRMR